jgi:RNA polymerase-binding protein DksA
MRTGKYSGWIMTQPNLNQIRKQLNARRAELTERNERVDRDLKRRNEPLSNDSADRAIQLQNDEVLQVIAAGAHEEIAEIDSALQRLELNLYGICNRCGKQVPHSRLAATPYATRCTTCA